MSNSPKTLSVRVQERQNEAQDIVSFSLVSADGSPLPPFDAGSHIDVHIPGGPTRQYSLYNPPSERGQYRIAVLRDPASRGGSTLLIDTVQAGAVLTISEPRNHFALIAGAASHLLLAGGIGITPLLCMAQTLHARSEPFELFYCTRERKRAAFLDALERMPWSRSAHMRFDNEQGQSGPVDFVALLKSPNPDRHLYVCGPQGFMNVVLAAARSGGWRESQIHFEYFAGVTPTASSDDASFEVRLAKSGRVIKVDPDKTVAQALIDAGVPVQVSCQQGVCGTCLTRVLEGVPDHRDMYFTAEEHAKGDQFLPCCSRSKSKTLVLDL